MRIFKKDWVIKCFQRRRIQTLICYKLGAYFFISQTRPHAPKCVYEIDFRNQVRYCIHEFSFKLGRCLRHFLGSSVPGFQCHAPSHTHVFYKKLIIWASTESFLTLIHVGGVFNPPRGFSCRVFQRHQLCPPGGGT